MSKDPRISEVEKLIEVCPDFPKTRISFKNLFPVLRDAAVFQKLIDVLVETVKQKFPEVEVIVGLDSRGFLFGPPVSLALGIAFVPVRKKGKLPGEKIKVEYSLEYGKDAAIYGVDFNGPVVTDTDSDIIVPSLPQVPDDNLQVLNGILSQDEDTYGFQIHLETRHYLHSITFDEN